MKCPNCLAELRTKERALFFACPKCNFLLLENGNKIRQVKESDIVEKYQQVGKFQRWICPKILKHEWSDQGYIIARYKAGCIKSRVCMRCFERQTKIEEHEFIEKYLHKGSCEGEDICRKCGVKNSDKWVSHSFSEWVADDKRPCTKTRKCKRCGSVEEKTEHQGKWVYLGSTTSRSDGTEKMISERRICQVCGAKEDREYLWESPWA